jgi:phosphoglycolate phosphatase-like HAD superfamily hydrolase
VSVDEVDDLPGGTWAFDVDGTLIGSIRSDVLRPGATDLLERLRHRGITCVLWSAGGGQYARRMATLHGIESLFEAFYSKGERDARGRYTTDRLAARHRPDVFVDDMPVDLPVGATVVTVAQFLGSNQADRALWEVMDRLGPS